MSAWARLLSLCARSQLAALAALLSMLAIAPAAAIEITQVKSPGGIEAWLVADRTLPIVNLRFAVRGGAAADPAGKEGLARLAAALFDEGAGPYPSQEFQKRLEDRAIALGFSAGPDNFSGNLRTLADARDQAFDLLRLALAEPRFDPEAIERMRGELMSDIKSRQDDPNYVAAREWFALVFGKHPYARPVEGTLDSLPKIARADLQSFAKTRLGRDRLVIAVSGAITAEELAPLLDKTFGRLPATAAASEIPEAALQFDGGTHVVEKDVPQSVVLFGGAGIKRNDPDWFAAYVMNYILGGGGFTSRLTEQVREKRGLAYSVYSHLSPLDHAGLVMGGVATENGHVAQSVDLIREEWAKFGADGVSDAELANAKTYLNGSFPLQLDSTAKIAEVLLSVQLDGLGIGYLDRRAGLIDAVTAEDVRRVARRLLDPKTLTFVVVGRPAGLAAAPGPREKDTRSPAPRR